VANDSQEWEICGIIDDEDVDGVPHYWVQWSPTLVSEFEMRKARALVARFEAGLRAQHQAASNKGRQAGSCRSSRNRSDVGEEATW
jgi:hypothetical protein